MREVFGSVYSDAYDLLYSDKDYASECDLIERIFGSYGDGPIRTVLDLGCGTGNHALPLAERGYEVVGVDRSESMLAHARRRMVGRVGSGDVTFHQGDIRAIELGRQFDAVLLMFAVLGYQLENPDVLSCLKTARRYLRPSGILIFDVWHGPAVLHQRPSERVKVVPIPGGEIARAASAELDTRRHLCTVHFHVRRVEGGRIVAETEESHPVRYFFREELDLFLVSSGFDPVRLGAFPEFDRDPNEETWNVLEVARAV